MQPVQSQEICALPHAIAQACMTTLNLTEVRVVLYFARYKLDQPPGLPERERYHIALGIDTTERATNAALKQLVRLGIIRQEQRDGPLFYTLNLEWTP